MAARKTLKFAFQDETSSKQEPVNEFSNDVPQDAEESAAPFAPKLSRTSIMNRESLRSLSRRSTRVTQIFKDFRNRRKRSTIILRPIEQFLPTYQLEPKNPFNPFIVRGLIEKLVNAEMERYGKISFHSEILTKNRVRGLSEICNNHIRAKDYDRYRIITQVTLLEKKYQEYSQTAAVCWDIEKDYTINYVYERSNFVLIVAVFGVYYD